VQPINLYVYMGLYSGI